MRGWKKGAAIAAAVVVAAGIGATGAAWAGGGLGEDGQPPASEVQANAPTRAASGGHYEDTFVPVTPCRVVDTRDAVAGKLQVGGARDVIVRGGGAAFAKQGGKAGGCGIPTSARAVEVTITAVESGSGFLRVWPSDLTQPNATFLNYDDAFNVSNTGTVALCGTSAPLCATDLDVRAYGTATHVVMDVAGYYVAPMIANVRASGVVESASRLTNVIAFGGGAYEVEFDRDVSECTYTATIDNYDGSPGGGMIAVDPRSGNAKAVYVQTKNTAGTNTNEPFFLEVTC